ncbi:ATP-grasp domain-containing protein [Streptomyces sp. NPDC001817]|uniref:ATP-grasp domain-containing protein n=1 Tax=Streptomyces sp. NPDC001817 TaxID=3154398 RepID=UPI0033190A84
MAPARRVRSTARSEEDPVDRSVRKLGPQDRALADLDAFAEAQGIDGVAGCCEFFTPLVAHLAACLGLPGNDPRRAQACRNKADMAQAFRAGQVPAPRTVSAHTAAEAAHALGRAGIGFPVVVKPAEQGGSWGVSVVGSPEQLDSAVDHAWSRPMTAPYGLPMDQRVVVQECGPGPEFSLDTVVRRGEYFHLPLIEKHTTDGVHRAETGSTCPAAVPPDDLRAVRTAVERALGALGIRNGVAHTEVKISRPGPRRHRSGRWSAGRPPHGRRTPCHRHRRGPGLPPNRPRRGTGRVVVDTADGGATWSSPHPRPHRSTPTPPAHSPTPTWK